MGYGVESPRQNFNSHTREGVTLILIQNSLLIQNFNSHTREGVTIWQKIIYVM